MAVLFALNDEIASLDKEIVKLHRADGMSRRLATVPGIGTLIATVLSATVGDPAAFATGREFAAYLGLVPRQHSTGGKAKLGKISKMGNRDLRRLLVVGSHAALVTKPFKLVAVALANKMARIAWAIMAKGGSYNAGKAEVHAT